MHISAGTLDDLLRKVIENLRKQGHQTNPTKGPATEIFGALLELTNPRARLSRTETKGTLFSCLGEFLWYLAKSNEVSFIEYYVPGYAKYSDDGTTIYGAYGPRLFGTTGNNQIVRIQSHLREGGDTRQAVVQLFDAQDIIEDHNDVPCTCTLQFVRRQGQLHMLTHMRSNDAFLGLPHDVFAFTMLQELVARDIGAELGVYRHAVGSLHLYNADFERADKFLNEGWQSRTAMPPMPTETQWSAVSTLLEAETVLRHGGHIDVSALGLADYWSDIVRLLQVFSLSKLDENFREIKNRRIIAGIKKEMRSPVYDAYIRRREDRLQGMV